MEITINNHVYNLKYGIKAIEALDNQYKKLSESGNIVELGSGVLNVVTGIQFGDVETIVRLIHVGTLATTPVSTTQIETDLDSIESAEEFKKVVDEVFTIFKEAPVVSLQYQKLGLRETEAKNSEEV